MILEEAVRSFIDGRKRGVNGAKGKATAATLEIYKRNLGAFTAFLQTEAGSGGIVKYESVRKAHLIEFLDWVDNKEREGKWSRSTAMQMIRCLRTFFRWVDFDEECRDEGLKGLQKYLPALGSNPRRTDIPQIKDIKQLKNAFNTDNRWGYRDYVMVCLILDTGLRLGEVTTLRVDHMRLEERTLIVNGKTGPRPVSITEEMTRLFRGWMKRRKLCKTAEESPFVFVSKYDPSITVNGFGQRLRKLKKTHGLALNISAHPLRHAFCTNYLRGGGDLERLRLMTGHTNYEMLKNYLHMAKVGSKESQAELERVSLLKQT